MADEVESSADPLSQTLAVMDAQCVVSGAFRASGRWAATFQPRARLKLVAVERGSCWISLPGRAHPVPLEAGDVAVLNGWRRVLIASEERVRGEAQEMRGPGRGEITAIGDGTPDEDTDTVVLGGHVEVNATGEDLLLTALNPLTVLRGRGGPAEEARTIRWLLRNLLREMSGERPGAAVIRHLHAQTLLVETFRAYLDDAGPVPPGWLKVMADPRLSAAVAALHAEPGRSWTLEELARLGTMSRTTFVERFRTAAGVPPMTYLHRWRMRLAERELLRGDVSVAQLAARLGYGSDSAFSTAFKNATGSSPRAYRHQSR